MPRKISQSLIECKEKGMKKPAFSEDRLLELIVRAIQARL
jgi:hypothetical protein